MNLRLVHFMLRTVMYFNSLMGLNHMPYSNAVGRFQSKHLPSICYCIILNCIYLVAFLLSQSFLVESIYNCERIMMLSIAFNTLSVVKVSLAIMTLTGIWIRRKRLLHVANSYAKIIQKYGKDFFELPRNKTQITFCVRLCLTKIFTSGSRLMMAQVQYFGYGSVMDCGMRHSNRLTMPYIASAVVASHMEVVLNCVDFNMFLAQAVGNMLLCVLKQHAYAIKSDLHLLCLYAPCRCRSKPFGDQRNCHHAIWLWQLQQDLALLNFRRRRLHGLQVQLVNIFQWKLLLLVYTSFLQGILALFKLVIFITLIDNFSLLEFSFYCGLIIIFYFDFMLRFYLFEMQRGHWYDFGVIYYKICLKLLLLRSGKASQRFANLLSRRLELTILEFSRQLQIKQSRVHRLQIVGLFDLNNATSYQISRAILMNVIILCQMGVKSMKNGSLMKSTIFDEN